MPVKCLICGNEFEKTLTSHLKFKHKMSKSDYLSQYPDAVLHTDEYKTFLVDVKDRVKAGNNKRIERLNENKKNKPSDIDIENLQLHDLSEISKKLYNQTFIDIPEQSVKSNKLKSIYKNSRDNAPPEKLQILMYLDILFAGYAIENNYIVEKRTVMGEMFIYRVLTDISIPLLKIDIEFPNAYWHNHEDYLYNRDLTIGLEDWKIIRVESIYPSITELEECLTNNDVLI